MILLYLAILIGFNLPSVSYQLDTCNFNSCGSYITSLLDLNFGGDQDKYDSFRSSVFNQLDRKNDGILSKKEFYGFVHDKKLINDYSDLFQENGTRFDRHNFDNLYDFIYKRKFLYNPDICDNVYKKFENQGTTAEIREALKLLNFQCSHGLSIFADYDIENCLCSSSTADKCINGTSLASRQSFIEQKMYLWVVQGLLLEKFPVAYFANISSVISLPLSEYNKKLNHVITQLNSTNNLTAVTSRSYDKILTENFSRESQEYGMLSNSTISLLKIQFPVDSSILLRHLQELSSPDFQLLVQVDDCHKFYEHQNLCFKSDPNFDFLKYYQDYENCLEGKFMFNPLYQNKFTDLKNSLDDLKLNNFSCPQDFAGDKSKDSLHFFKKPRTLKTFATLIVFTVLIGSAVAIIVGISKAASSSEKYHVKKNAVDRSMLLIQKLNSAKYLKPSSCESVSYYWGTCGIPGSLESKFCPGGRVFSNESCFSHNSVGDNFGIVCALGSPVSVSVPFRRNKTNENDNITQGTGEVKISKKLGSDSFECQSLCVQDYPDKCSK